MTDVSEIKMIPVSAITVLNPRARNKRVFQELVTSIERLGLKKPITVSQRPDRPRFDLVCGQGRLEAFIALGQDQIPAIIIDASEDDCFVMSLVENLARRQHTPLELVRAIGSLRERGYTVNEVAATADELGIQVGDEVKAMLDAHSVSFSGGSISLHSDKGIPLRALGVGSTRLLTAGLQRKASANATMVLVDELEHGLERTRRSR